MNVAPVFSPRVILAWISATAAIFALSIYVMTFVDSGRVEVGPSVYSRSAVGYAGFADLMQRLGVRVVKGPGALREAAESTNLLVITDAGSMIQSDDRRRALSSAKNVLFIMPKWSGAPSDAHSGWIDKALLLPPSQAGWMVAQAGSRGRTVRADAPVVFTSNVLGSTPTVETVMQLIEASDLRPIVARADAILVGERIDSQKRTWIVSDPDIFANHGLLKGTNAEFAVRLVNRLVSIGGAAVFTEMPPNYQPPPSNPFRLLFIPPFVLVTVNALATFALLLWATMPRFGRPDPTPPSLTAGKQGLIRNAAGLLAFAARREPIVASYVRANVRAVARRLRAPPQLDQTRLIELLDQIGRARGHAGRLAEIVARAEQLATGARADAAALVEAARDIHRWKQEMLRGS